MIPLAVFGDPIGHSLSPQLHQLFAQQSGVEVDYRAILAPPPTFAQQLKRFFSEGGVGANITLPHKVNVMALADEVSSRAALAGAANTLHLVDGQLRADNTDGVGLVRDLTQQLGALTGLRILMLGAGGAVRGIIGPLLDAGCASIVLRNRSIEKAEAIVEVFSQRRVRTYSANLDDQGSFDLVINAISAGHQQQNPFSAKSGMQILPAWLAQTRLAYDLSYGRAAAPFLNAVNTLRPSLAVSDGLGMLVAQGAASFAIWTGHEVEFTQALRALRDRL